MFILTLLTLKIEYVIKIINMINEVYVFIKKKIKLQILFTFLYKTFFELQ